MNTNKLFEQAIQLLHQRYVEESQKVFSQLDVLDTNYLELGLKYADKLGEFGYKEIALLYYDKMLDRDPNSYKAYFNKGVTLCECGQFEKALECFELASKIEIPDVLFYLQKGQLLNELQKYDEALGCFNQALQIERDPRILMAKAITFFNLRRKQECIDSFEDSIKIAPKEFVIWINYGSVMCSFGDYEKAIKLFDKSLEIQATPIAYYYKGQALSELLRYNEAIFYYELALSLEPQNNKYTSALILCHRRLEDLKSQQKPNNDLIWYMVIGFIFGFIACLELTQFKYLQEIGAILTPVVLAIWGAYSEHQKNKRVRQQEQEKFLLERSLKIVESLEEANHALILDQIMKNNIEKIGELTQSNMLLLTKLEKLLKISESSKLCQFIRFACELLGSQILTCNKVFLLQRL